MHAITFELKRAHLQGVAFGRSVIKKRVKGMTPARFDLMYAIRVAYLMPGGRRWPLATRELQSTIRRRLGLHPSTVSKTIKRLIETGWLERQGKFCRDRRVNIIAFTELGMRKIVKAMRIVFQMRTHLKHFEDLFRCRARCRDRHIIEVLSHVWDDIHKIATSFGDDARLPYDIGYGWEGAYG
jgi:DNA-binding MarR family transcriptional regulator